MGRAGVVVDQRAGGGGVGEERGTETIWVPSVQCMLCQPPSGRSPCTTPRGEVHQKVAAAAAACTRLLPPSCDEHVHMCGGAHSHSVHTAPHL